MIEKLPDDFNEFAHDYRTIHNQNIRITGADSLYFAEQKVTILHEYECDNSLSFLDIGCGDGSTEFFISKTFPGWIIRGLDISDASLREASKKNIPNSIFEVFDGSHVPVQDCSVDIVFIASVLHHVPKEMRQTILNETFRVLKPCGRLYLFEHNPLNPVTKYIVNTCVFDKNASLLRAGTTKNLVTNAGYAKILRKYILFFPRSGFMGKLKFFEKYLGNFPFGGQYYFRCVK